MQQEKCSQEEGGEPREEVEPAIARLADDEVQAMCTSHLRHVARFMRLPAGKRMALWSLEQIGGTND